MKAIAKTRSAPGVELIEVDEPQIRPGHVKLKLEAASVCGTDLHIYEWDAWSASRVKPTRIIGHEFCGTIVEVAADVTDRQVGQFVSSESHITCGHCRQCLRGQGHVCVNTTILGVDVDGGFGEYAVIPAANARPTHADIPRKFAAFQDALGNAVHTAFAGPIEGQKILITGLGPIGLFAVSICKAMNAELVVGTEISPYRIGLAEQVGIDAVVNPRDGDATERLRALCPDGFDGVLEMSGHGSSLDLAVDLLRPGGRLSLLGVFHENRQSVRLNDLIFKGVEIQCIVGRRIWETWDQMARLWATGKLNVDPVVSHVLPFTEFESAMNLMKRGEAGKVVFTFE